MAKLILICGKICSGKTCYAQKLKETEKAVVLSSDELISDLIHPNENIYHDQIINNVHEYLIKKAIEILRAGANVIFDWGFWMKETREALSKRFEKENIEYEWHYINISNKKLKEQIEKRNALVLKGESRDYLVDENLFNKMHSIFEPMTKEERDFIEIKNS